MSRFTKLYRNDIDLVTLNLLPTCDLLALLSELAAFFWDWALLRSWLLIGNTYHDSCASFS